MRIAQDARFRVERERYSLRFCCESCAGFDPDAGVSEVESVSETESVRCAYGYPVDDHRLARYRDPEVEIVFCKDYDSV